MLPYACQGIVKELSSRKPAENPRKRPYSKSFHDIVLSVKGDRINEFIAKFLNDLAKAIFTVGVVSQLFKDFPKQFTYRSWDRISGIGHFEHSYPPERLR